MQFSLVPLEDLQTASHCWPVWFLEQKTSILASVILENICLKYPEPSTSLYIDSKINMKRRQKYLCWVDELYAPHFSASEPYAYSTVSALAWLPIHK